MVNKAIRYCLRLESGWLLREWISIILFTALNPSFERKAGFLLTKLAKTGIIKMMNWKTSILCRDIPAWTTKRGGRAFEILQNCNKYRLYIDYYFIGCFSTFKRAEKIVELIIKK
jgi:hypothetical protein